MDYFRAGAANLSLYAIPAYYALCFQPHLYASGMLKGTKELAAKTNGKVKDGKLFYNMPNPRSAENPAKYASILDKATFAKWERARGAHNNLLESAPFVVSAILAGVITKLPAEHMNLASAVYLASRVAYIQSYIRVESGPAQWLRTLWFFFGNGILIWMWVKAGQKIAAGDY